jgi:hypothetical protein
MSLPELVAFIPPPSSLVDESGDWASIERDLTQLPNDYKSLVTSYGLGSFDGFVWVFNLLQTVPPRPQGPEGEPNGAARAGGFSLHAGVDIAPNERAKLERLCRYVSRPPVASERLALTASGQVRYTLKTPYRDVEQPPFEPDTVA